MICKAQSGKLAIGAGHCLTIVLLLVLGGQSAVGGGKQRKHAR